MHLRGGLREQWVRKKKERLKEERRNIDVESEPVCNMCYLFPSMYT